MSRHLLPAVLLSLAAFTACKRETPPASAPPAKSAAAPAAYTPPATPPPNDTPGGQRIEADLRALADDAMEGRDTGTPGYDKAAEYVAQQFQKIGLVPAGDDGSWFQRVPMISVTQLADGARLAITRDGKVTELTFNEQFFPSTAATLKEAVAVEAPAVYVAHAVHAPELGHDDFAGLDLKGKIAVLLSDAPDTFDTDLRAYYSSTYAKQKAIVERGAIGTILVPSPALSKRWPWKNFQSHWDEAGMSVLGEDGKPLGAFPQLQAAAVLRPEAAETLFEGSGHKLADLFAAAAQGKAKGFDLPGTVAIAAKAKYARLDSRNVVGKLPGSDAALTKEYIAYTAHLDHTGIGKEVDGDKIYNGAFDNALGVAVMLEAARELQAAPAKPKRSSLFIALTGEEKGLRGSQWFAHKPTVPKDALVADINMDMPVLLVPTSDVVPIGVDHSTLKAALDQAAKDVGVTLSPDPMPEETVFIRSDQFSFVREGIPAVYLSGGVVGTDPKQDAKAAFGWFLSTCYHKPCDQADLPIQYGDAARLAKLNARIGQIVGDAAERPKWNEGDFFGGKFGKQAK